jgi:hypothetical protein
MIQLGSILSISGVVLIVACTGTSNNNPGTGGGNGVGGTSDGGANNCGSVVNFSIMNYR